MGKTILKDAFDLFEGHFGTSHSGFKANARGKLLGSVLAQAADAVPVFGDNNNLCHVDGVQFRFHSSESKSISINPETEGQRSVGVFRYGKADDDGMAIYLTYGLTLEECIQIGKPIPNKTGTTPRLGLHIGRVSSRARLGIVYVPKALIEADNSEHRELLMTQIKQLTSNELGRIMDATTRENIRNFVLAGEEQQDSDR